MFSLLAIHYHTARLVFEAQNAMTFRLLRLVSDAGKLVPDEAPDKFSHLFARRTASAPKGSTSRSQKACFYQQAPQEDRAR